MNGSSPKSIKKPNNHQKQSEKIHQANQKINEKKKEVKTEVKNNKIIVSIKGERERERGQTKNFVALTTNPHQLKKE